MPRTGGMSAVVKTAPQSEAEWKMMPLPEYKTAMAIMKSGNSGRAILFPEHPEERERGNERPLKILTY